MNRDSRLTALEKRQPPETVQITRVFCVPSEDGPRVVGMARRPDGPTVWRRDDEDETTFRARAALEMMDPPPKEEKGE